MKKSFTIFYIVTFLLFVASSVYGTAFGSPSAEGVPAPLTQVSSASGTQYKRGGIAVTKLNAGNLNVSNPSITKFTSTGKLGVAFSGSYLNSNPTEALDVHGLITISDNSQPGMFLCSNSSGTLTPCGATEYFYDGKNCSYNNSGVYQCGSTNTSSPSVTKQFKVPTGVTSINVELWGAGGAGYGTGNSSKNYSPDVDVNYSSTCSSGGYSCIIGGSTYFLDTNGTSIIFRAKGGYGATSAHTGASGGGYSVSSASGIIDHTSTSGTSGTGGTSPSGTPSVSYSAFICGVTSYNAYYAIDGGDGGSGGKSGSGSVTPGGAGGHAGANILTLPLSDICAGVSTPQNGKGYLGENGLNGVYGSGGSGAGGKGGKSDQNVNNLCNGSCTAADQGYAGGGGGGYVNASITVTPGQVYTIKLSHSGNVQGLTETTTCILNFYSDSCAYGANSGNGSPSYARITY
jgi:hypothetical protein